MFDGSEFLNAVKATLDADNALNVLLGTKTDDSKVFLRSLPPDAAMFPILLVSDMAIQSLPAGQRTKAYAIAFDVEIWTNAKNDGAANYEQIYTLLARIDALLRSFSASQDAWRYVGFEVTASGAAEFSEGVVRKVVTYQGKGFEV